ncbi:MAG: polymer-forming cytoskeletal protein [Clostridia bacterium]|nr:polymer-forming cytoskeletal protein [Clostridia bacterium]
MGIFEEKKSIAEPTGEVKMSTDIISEVAVVSSSTKIEGNIRTDGHLIVNGDVQGNVSSRGNLILTGNAFGEIYCESLLVETPESNADIIAEQNVIVKEGTVLKGNVHCKNITVLGTVVGDITATGSVVLKATAVVNGNVIAKRIGMENGAKLNGAVEMK